MAIINVEQITGIVRNGNVKYKEGELQEFNAATTNFDHKTSKMFFIENHKPKIARPATTFLGLFTVLSRARVVPDTERAGEKEMTNHAAFLDYFKKYSGSPETPKPIFLILEERWIEVNKDEYLPNDQNLFVLEYDLEGENERIQKRLTVQDGNKVVFNPAIFEVDKKPVSQEKTSRFRLFHFALDKQEQTLVSAQPPDKVDSSSADPFHAADFFTLRFAEPKTLKAELAQLVQSIMERMEQKRLLQEALSNISDQDRENLIERIDGLLISFDITNESPRETLDRFFQDTYGGQPDKDDLEAYLDKNFAEFHQLLQETEKEE